MIEVIILILSIIAGNIILPAIIGIANIPIISIFLLSVILYGKDIKTAVFKSILFGLIIEIIFRHGLGTITVPLLLMGIIYYWLRRLADIRIFDGNIEDQFVILKQSIFLTITSLLYAFFHIVHETSYNIVNAWLRFELILNFYAIISAFFISVIFTLIFNKYVLGTRSKGIQGFRR